ncbi:20522_t:CDS:2, partial [Dentiscutata erythropus]
LTMQTHSFELFPDRGLIHIFLFSEVKNSSELRKRLLSHDTELSYAFINARINEALRRFGISDDSTNIIVVKVGGEANE